MRLRSHVRFAGAGEADVLACCDNLELAASYPPGAFQLLYLDPPFSTGVARRARSGVSFADRFANMEAYLAFLTPRLEAAHRLLADDGSLFVHLDWHVVHYVKVALDRIFGPDRFVNEIVWCYSVGGKSPRSFGRKHDTLLFYGRTERYVFHSDEARIPRRRGSHMRIVDGNEINPVQEKTDRATGRVYRYPIHEGKVAEDWWTDIETLNRADAERTGYPTQKPERLIERIVRVASDPGRLVGDLFLGSGTTALVARRLGRRFVGADRSEEAIRTTLARLERDALRTPLSPPRDLHVLESEAGAGPTRPVAC